MTAWDEIVREHGPPAYRTAWRILRHTEDCEDVLQDVFVEAHQLHVEGKVTHWRTFLCRLVTYRALDQLRRRKPNISLNDLPLLDTAPGPDRLAMLQEEGQQLRQWVAELPEHQAAVFCLAHFEGLSHSEIAIALEITNNAVAIALHKARHSLRSIFVANQKDNRS